MLTQSSPIRWKLLTLIGLVLCYLGVKYTHHTICIERSKEVVMDVDTLVDELDSSLSCVRSRAAFDLQKVGGKGKPAIPRLLSLLDDPIDSIRWRSVAALGHIGSWDETTKARVYTMIEDPNKTTRLNTLFAISRMRYDLAADGRRPDYYNPKPLSADALMVFRRALDDPIPKVVVKSMLHFDPKELENLDPSSKEEYIKKIKSLLKSRHEEVRLNAMLTLARTLPTDEMRTVLPDYLAQLRSYTKSDDRFLRIRALRAVARSEGKTLPLLMDGAEGQTEAFKRRCMKRAQEFDPMSSCFHLGQLYEYQGDKKRAYAYYEQSCAKAPGDRVAGCEKLGDRALAAGNTTLAQDYYERSAQVYGTRSDALPKLASLLMQKGEHENACFWLVLSCGNKNENACKRAATCPDLEQALAARKKAKNRDAKASVAMTNKAHKLKRSGNLEAAIGMLEESWSKGNGFAVTSLSDMYVEVGRTKDALTLLENACHSMEPLSCSWLGRLYSQQGMTKAAEAAYKRECNINRSGCGESLAYFYATQGKADKAREEYRLLCNLTIGERQKEYCEKAKKQAIPVDAAQLENDCLSNDYTACRKLRALYEKNLAHEKTVALDKRLCEADRKYWSCRNYLGSLLSLGKQSEHDEFLASFCPDGIDSGSIDACLALARRNKVLGRHLDALELEQAACLKYRKESYCRRMRKTARLHLKDAEYRSLLSRLCETESHATSCLTLALRDDAQPQAVSDALQLLLKEVNKECLSGEPHACSEEGIVRCALGQKVHGRALLLGACKLLKNGCPPEINCDNAMALVKERFK